MRMLNITSAADRPYRLLPPTAYRLPPLQISCKKPHPNPDAPYGWSGRDSFRIRWTCDVEMRPADVSDEWFEKEWWPRWFPPARAQYFFQICDFRFHMIRVWRVAKFKAAHRLRVTRREVFA